MAASGARGPARLRVVAVRTRSILFVSEAVTLAQVVRLVTLARALDPARYVLHFAAARFSEMIFAGTAFQRHEIHSLSPRSWGARFARGDAVLAAPLARYVQENAR